MKNWALWVSVLAAAAVPLTASAGHRKPGLWQSTIDTKFTKGGPQIPPEQLEKMKQMGIALPFGGPQTVKSCLTPEKAASEDQPDSGQKQCQLENKVWTSNSFSADLVCKSAQGISHGTIKASFSSDTVYTAVSHVEGTNPHLGGDFAMDGQIDAKWLAADCGDVK